jgi:hypothetical protein
MIASPKAMLAQRLAVAKGVGAKPPKAPMGASPFRTPANPFMTADERLVHRFIPKVGRL